jgi:GDSL-like Lipase/Acylhydrolase family
MKKILLSRLFGFLFVFPLAACSAGGPSSKISGGAGSTDAGQGGVAGMTGVAGGSGTAGTMGGAGAVGAAGDPGTAGASGAAGQAGVPGSAGATGTAGAAGASAPDASADSGVAVVPFPSTQTVKLMVVGSSNEIGTCWRAYLWQELHLNDITNFHFVGQQSGGPSCTVMGWNDTALQAMSGIIVTNLPASTYLGWFTANPPDVILMHFGGADILAGMPVDGVMKAYATALAQARMVNPKVVLLIAEHTPEGKDAIVTLDADVAAWAPTVSTAASPVIAVDLYTGMLPSDFSDGVHLNATGAQKVADRFYKALAPFFK